MWKSEHRYQPRGSATLRLRTWTQYVLIYRRRLRSSAISGSILGHRASHLSAALQPGAQVPCSVHKMLFLYPGLGLLNMTLVLFVISIVQTAPNLPMYNGSLHSRSCSALRKLEEDGPTFRYLKFLPHYTRSLTDIRPITFCSVRNVRHICFSDSSRDLMRNPICGCLWVKI